MAARRDTTPATISASRIKWLEEEGRAVARDIREARTARSWSAVAALRRQRQSLRGELDTERLRLATLAQEPAPASPTCATWEEFEPRWRAWLETAPLDALELAGVTWLSRLGLFISVDTATGLPSIVRSAA